MRESEPSQSTPADSSELGSRTNVQTIVLMVVTALGVYLCYRLVAPLMSALTWALALALLFVPLQRWLESRLKRYSVGVLIP
jgi:predicted PurR-regulated permease PerM